MARPVRRWSRHSRSWPKGRGSGLPALRPRRLHSAFQRFGELLALRGADGRSQGQALALAGQAQAAGVTAGVVQLDAGEGRGGGPQHVDHALAAQRAASADHRVQVEPWGVHEANLGARTGLAKATTRAKVAPWP